MIKQSTIMAAYLSDTDLATLHKMRLDEKNHYKLSLWNQNSADHSHKSINKMNSCNKKKSLPKQQNTWKKTINERVPSTDSIKSESSCSSKSSNVSKTFDISNRLEQDLLDEGYFSSHKSSRKRSGTWP